MFKIDGVTSKSTQQPADKSTMAKKAQAYIMSEDNYAHTYLKGYLECKGIEVKPVAPFQYTTSEQEDIYYVNCPSDEDVNMFNSFYLDPFDADKDGKLSYTEYAEEQKTMFKVDDYKDLLTAEFESLDEDKNDELNVDEDIKGRFNQDPSTIDANTKAAYSGLYLTPYDKDKNGSLNKEEYIKRYAAEAGLVAEEEDIAAKFASYNVDGDQFISENENMLWMYPDILKAPTPEAKKAYLENARAMSESQISLYDGDGDGCLNAQEYNTKREYEHYNLNPAHEYGRDEMTEYDKGKTAREFDNLDLNADELIGASELTMLYALQDCDSAGVMDGNIDYGFLATDVVGLSDPNTKQFFWILAQYFGI